MKGAFCETNPFSILLRTSISITIGGFGTPVFDADNPDAMAQKRDMRLVNFFFLE
jgi:hypothetical protein